MDVKQGVSVRAVGRESNSRTRILHGNRNDSPYENVIIYHFCMHEEQERNSAGGKKAGAD